MAIPAQYIAACHSRYRFVLVLVGTLLLLGMQLALMLHELDLDHHTAGEQCEVCLHLPAIGHGLPTASPTALPIVPAPPPAAEITFLTPSIATVYFHPRAPPLHS